MRFLYCYTNKFIRSLLSIISWQAHMVSIKFPKFYPCLAGSSFNTSIIFSFLLGNNKLISFIFKKIPDKILCLHNYSLSFFQVKNGFLGMGWGENGSAYNLNNYTSSFSYTAIVLLYALKVLYVYLFFETDYFNSGMML